MCRKFLLLLLLLWPVSLEAQTLQRTVVNWTSATGSGTRSIVPIQGLGMVTVTLSATSTMTGGQLSFVVDDDNDDTVSFTQPCMRRGSPTTESTFTLSVTTQSWICDVRGMVRFWVALSNVITGTGTATVAITPSSLGPTVSAPVTLVDPTNTTITLAPDATQGAAVQASGPQLLGEYNASPATVTTGQAARLQTDTNGRLLNVLSASAQANGALTSYTLTTASTNAANIKASAGNVYSIRYGNPTGTAAYLQLYNTSGTPGCAAGAGYVESVYLAANQTEVTLPNVVPAAYSAGLGICVTGAVNTSTNAPAGVLVTILYE